MDRIGYVHFTDTDGTLRDGATSKHLPAGDGHVDIPASLRTLKDGGFRGWLMVDAWEVPDPYDACARPCGRSGRQGIDRSPGSIRRFAANIQLPTPKDTAGESRAGPDARQHGE